jgi:hypothetical protein
VGWHKSYGPRDPRRNDAAKSRCSQQRCPTGAAVPDPWTLAGKAASRHASFIRRVSASSLDGRFVAMMWGSAHNATQDGRRMLIALSRGNHEDESDAVDRCACLVHVRLARRNREA